MIRIFRAVSDIRHNGLPVGVLTTRVSVDKPLTEELLRQMEQAIKDNPIGTRVPATHSVVIVNLIELEA